MYCLLNGYVVPSDDALCDKGRLISKFIVGIVSIKRKE